MISESRCNCTACRSVSIERRSRSRISAISQVALALGEAFSQLSHIVAMPLQFGLSVRKLLPLRAERMITTGDERVALDQPAVPLGNLSFELGPQRFVILQRCLQLRDASLAVRERGAEIGVGPFQKLVFDPQEIDAPDATGD